MACVGHVWNECTDMMFFLLTLCSSVSSMFSLSHPRRACIHVDAGCHHFLGSLPPVSMVVCAFAKKHFKQVSGQVICLPTLILRDVCLAFKEASTEGSKKLFFF